MSQNSPLDTDLESYSVAARTVLSLKPSAKPLGELALYTAAAGSALALASGTEASIIYSGVKDITVNRATDKTMSAKVNLNDDSKDDIQFHIASSIGGPLPPTPVFQERNYAAIDMIGPGGILTNDPKHPLFNTVGLPTQGWVNTDLFRGVIRNYDPRYPGGYPYHTYGKGTHATQGLWNPGKTGTIEGFEGIKLDNNNFGWLQFKLTTKSNFTDSLTLVDWAYQSVPGASIHVGDKGIPSVPEPSPLSLMALGAAGIAVLRRRRKPEKSSDTAH